MSDQWTSAELFAELRSFEEALKAARLQPNTIDAYVGRADTFLRWLVGDYSPRGPNESSARAAAQPALRGEHALMDFRDTFDLETLRRHLRDYATVTGYDVALRDLRSSVPDSIDPSQKDHATALLNWLRRWGCRHLRREDNEFSAQALEVWWLDWNSKLPPSDVWLTSGTAETFDLAIVYEALAKTVAAHRSYGGREVDVRLGDTAAAKTLYALRPRSFIPWDEPIRLSFSAPAFDGASYIRFLGLAADALEGAAKRFKVEVLALPELLGRPTSTPAKLVDEYLWMRITRDLGPSPLEAGPPVMG